jgi:phospholipase C
MSNAEDAIDRVVVLMLENRSFDHMLGSLGLNGLLPMDGLTSAMSNPDQKGKPVKVRSTTQTVRKPDPNHLWPHVQAQLAGGNQGFVKDYASLFPQGQEAGAEAIMGYYDPSSKILDVLHHLAQEYTVSDRWFCSLPSETWPNRLFAHAATSDGRVKNGLPQILPPELFTMRTVYDLLEAKGLTWSCYNDQFPQMICISHLAGLWLSERHDPNGHFRSIATFYQDCRNATLPNYSFIEPIYFFSKANDDHPPDDVTKGEQFIADIYHELRTSSLWERSALIVLFDEHGGFFDHANPPSAIPPSPGPYPNGMGFGFDQLGPRVPAVIVSPWVKKGCVVRPARAPGYDHTSLIATAAKKWNLGTLTARDAIAPDLWEVFSEPQPRTDDTGTRDYLTGWTPSKARPVVSMAEAAAIPASEPGPDFVGVSGRDVANHFADLKRRKAFALEAGEATRPLSDFQSSLCDLADAVRAL